MKRKRIRRKGLKGGMNNEGLKNERLKSEVIALYESAKILAKKYLEDVETDAKKARKTTTLVKGWFKGLVQGYNHEQALKDDYKYNIYKRYAEYIPKGTILILEEGHPSDKYEIKDLFEEPSILSTLKEYIEELINYFNSVDVYLNQQNKNNLKFLNSKLRAKIKLAKVLSLEQKRIANETLAVNKRLAANETPAANETLAVNKRLAANETLEANKRRGGYRRTKRRRSIRSRHK